jgi:hypothetical protein
LHAMTRVHADGPLGSASSSASSQGADTVHAQLSVSRCGNLKGFWSGKTCLDTLKFPQPPTIYVGTTARPQLFPFRALVGRGIKRKAARQSAEEQAYSQECCDVQAWGLMPSESPQSVDCWQQEAVSNNRNTHISRRRIQWRFTLTPTLHPSMRSAI